MSLVQLKYPSEGFLNKLLSSCPVLEDLAVEQCPDDNVTVLAVKIPSLKTLSLRKSKDVDEDQASGFLIDAPSLESFDVLDHGGEFCVIENDMPEIVYANVDVNYWQPWNIFGSVSSVKHLELCLPSSKVTISCDQSILLALQRVVFCFRYRYSLLALYCFCDNYAGLSCWYRLPQSCISDAMHM